MPAAPLLAVTAALAFAVAGIILKRALATATPLAAALISVAFTFVFIWTLAAATAPLELVLSPRITPFLVAGLVAPGLSRLAMFVGVHRVGVARTAALIAMSPLFAIAMATMMLGERPTGRLLAGAGCVVAGGVLLARRQRDDGPWRRRDLMFPLLGALGFAVRDVISRSALLEFPEPVLGAAAATSMSLLVIGLCGYLRGDVRLRTAGAPLLAAAGLCEALGSLCVWTALARGPVSVVSPLVNAQPLFTVILVLLFLRGIERVTWRVVVASALVVGGVVFVVGAGA